MNVLRRRCARETGQDKISDFELKLMDIDSEHLGIPETDYEVTIKMPSAEFQRICRDLASIGDTVTIAVTKDGVKFTTAGDIGDANITLRQNADDEKEKNISIELSEPVTLTFALRYLNSFTKATPLSDQVMIRLSAQLPIVVQYVIESVGYVAYFLGFSSRETFALSSYASYRSVELCVDSGCSRGPCYRLRIGKPLRRLRVLQGRLRQLRLGRSYQRRLERSCSRL